MARAKTIVLTLFASVCCGMVVHLRAQCRKDEVLAGEDEKYWYCASRNDFPEAAAEIVFDVGCRQRRSQRERRLPVRQAAAPAIDAAEVVDPEAPRSAQASARAFFGATVRYANSAGAEREVSIVGTDVHPD